MVVHKLHGQVLEGLSQVQNTLVDISGNLSWNTPIDRITGNASRTLNFLKRNITTKNPKVRETAYNALVRSLIWDPHNKNKILQLKNIQRRADAGSYATMIIGQALQLCFNSLLEGPLNKNRQMRVYDFSSKLSMGLCQYLSQIIYSQLTEFPGSAIQ